MVSWHWIFFDDVVKFSGIEIGKKVLGRMVESSMVIEIHLKIFHETLTYQYYSILHVFNNVAVGFSVPVCPLSVNSIDVS